MSALLQVEPLLVPYRDDDAQTPPPSPPPSPPPNDDDQYDQPILFPPPANYSVHSAHSAPVAVAANHRRTSVHSAPAGSVAYPRALPAPQAERKVKSAGNSRNGSRSAASFFGNALPAGILPCSECNTGYYVMEDGGYVCDTIDCGFKTCKNCCDGMYREAQGEPVHCPECDAALRHDADADDAAAEVDPAVEADRLRHQIEAITKRMNKLARKLPQGVRPDHIGLRSLKARIDKAITNADIADAEFEFAKASGFPQAQVDHLMYARNTAASLRDLDQDKFGGAVKNLEEYMRLRNTIKDIEKKIKTLESANRQNKKNMLMAARTARIASEAEDLHMDLNPDALEQLLDEEEVEQDVRREERVQMQRARRSRSRQARQARRQQRVQPNNGVSFV